MPGYKVDLSAALKNGLLSILLLLSTAFSEAGTSSRAVYSVGVVPQFETHRLQA